MLNGSADAQPAPAKEKPYLLEWDPETRSALLRFFGFNTLVTIVAYAGDGEAADTHFMAALEDCYDACVRYEGLFSRTIESSDIGRLNSAKGKRIAIDRDTFRMLQAAEKFCEASDGVFDITIGSATTLWDFNEGIVPKAEQLAEAVTHIDWRKLQLTEEDGACFAQLLDPMAKVDAGGIAKGWITDQLVKQLGDAGVVAALVDLGGNVGVLGQKPEGSPWRIGIRDPRTSLAEEGYLDVIELKDGSVATSGTYERRFDDGETSHHHILDVRTGQSLEVPWASASVVADDATHAEGFSTTMLSLDEEGARRMMGAHPEIRQVIFVTDDGELTVVER